MGTFSCRRILFRLFRQHFIGGIICIRWNKHTHTHTFERNPLTQKTVTAKYSRNGGKRFKPLETVLHLNDFFPITGTRCDWKRQVLYPICPSIFSAFNVCVCVYYTISLQRVYDFNTFSNLLSVSKNRFLWAFFLIRSNFSIYLSIFIAQRKRTAFSLITASPKQIYKLMLLIRFWLRVQKKWHLIDRFNKR